MKRFLPVLDTIVTVAPLLGIFGTVTGIYHSFASLGAAGRAIDPALVANGIAEAIITTIAGLAIALPTVVFYNYFLSRVESAWEEIASQATNFQIVYRKGKEKQEYSKRA